MVEHLILEFPTETEAQACVDAIDTLAATRYWPQRGHTIVQGTDGPELVGKNALTGEDMPNAARTITWDTVKESPDGTWYFTSLSSDPRFPDWKTMLADAGFTAIGTEKTFPAEWIIEELA